MCSNEIKYDNTFQVAGTGGWVCGLDYYRMDGSTSAQTRKSTVAAFNDPDNARWVIKSCERMQKNMIYLHPW